MAAPPAHDWDRNLNDKSSRPVKELAKSVYLGTRSLYPHVWIGRGWDTPTTSEPAPPSGQWDDEHGSGRALDIICAPEVGIRSTGVYLAAGEAIVAWLIAHAEQMHIRHIIWQNRIYKVRYGRWETLSGNRRGISNRHEDHIHVFFENTSGAIPAFTPEGEDMPLTSDDIDRIARATQEKIFKAEYGGSDDTFGGRISRLIEYGSEAAYFSRQAAERVGVVHRPGDPNADADGNVSALREIADTKTMLLTLGGQVAGLVEALKAVAAGGVDTEAILRRVDEAVERGLASATVTLRVGGPGGDRA